MIIRLPVDDKKQLAERLMRERLTILYDELFVRAPTNV